MEREADVVIVGGGIIGCAAAYYLTKRGVKAVVLEKEGIVADGASGRNLGIVAAIARHPVILPFAVECMKIWNGLSAELGFDTSFVQGGCIYVAATEKILEVYKEFDRQGREAGVDCRMISSDEVKKLVQGINDTLPVGALYCPTDGYADPPTAVKAIADGAKKLGAHIYTNTTCWDIEVSGGKVSSVVTDKGEIKTTTVIDAAGPYADRVARMVGAHVPMKTISLSCLETEYVPPKRRYKICGSLRNVGIVPTNRETLLVGGFYGPPLEYDIGFNDFLDMGLWMPRFRVFSKVFNLHFSPVHLWRQVMQYLAPTQKARKIAEFSSFWPRVKLGKPEKLQEGIQGLLWEDIPALKGIKVTKAWAGIDSFTADTLPILGEIGKHKGFVIATGFSGHGFAIGPIMGKMITELVTDGKTSIPIGTLRLSRFYEGKVEMPWVSLSLE